MDYLNYPYQSQRMTAIANQGMVATSQPLASQAGLDLLKKGGNAVDAAIATAATLTVVEPTSNGIGGDAFALVWMKDELHGLNASGPAPASISIDALKHKGYDEMPTHGFMPVTVPGVPAAWKALSDRFGKLPFHELLQPAIHYAEKGYPISPTLGRFWEAAVSTFQKKLTGEEFSHWFETFAPKGRAPQIGETWSSPNHAATLRSLAETNVDSFYQGELAEKMAQFSREYGGFLSLEDLQSYEPEWVTPISVPYRGYDVWEIPPNGQGIVALQALNLLRGYDFHEKEAAETYHLQIEAMKLAFADGHAHLADLAHMKTSVSDLLSEAYAKERRSLIHRTARLPEAGVPTRGGTVYLATADKEGNMVSYIQSNYMGFGSGLVVPGTGIALQNRGHNFSLDKAHPNALQGGKRSYHTIIPGFLTKDGHGVGPFGVMGGFMQPQGHVQVVMNTLDFHLNPQAALDAPRWQWMKDRTVWVEPHFPNSIAQQLMRIGHDVHIQVDGSAFGRGQIIWRDNETGTLYGGTESRTDGSIASY
ncbi:gamma-glutamyltransferase family protein [Pontibacillus halophilus]|nr:gamma-glutamyltransferase family protein [Pontibacillus halophilus]